MNAALASAGIQTDVAHLESTSIVLVHGLDLFCTRVQPSSTFDLLQEDFPFAFLVLITSVFGIAAFVLKYLGERSALKAKWQ